MMHLRRIRSHHAWVVPSWVYLIGTVTALLIANAATAAKTEICHSQRVLRVGQADLAEHFAHGDHVLAAETCNTVDDDCDGVIDDDPTDLGVCTAGVGVCAAGADETCVAGTIECPAIANPPDEDPERTCDDGLDNDCDGLLDDISDPDCRTMCPTCGDGACHIVGGENAANCRADCFCGDGVCHVLDLETSLDCGVDCGCGDDICDFAEDRTPQGFCGACSADCFEACCGNAICEASEGPLVLGDGARPRSICGTCNMDCGASSCCGDQICSDNNAEDSSNCPIDCSPF